MSLVKQDLDAWLDQVSYGELNSPAYVPSEFALTFMNFIKLVNGKEGESHKTPPVHLAMLDKMVGPSAYIANLCFRGAAKALSLDTEILTTEGWSTIAALQVGDRIFGEDGKPTTVVAKSGIFQKKMFRLHLADGRMLDVSEDHINVIIHKRVRRVEGRCATYYERREVTTKELLGIPLGSTRTKTGKNPKGWENSVWVPLAQAIEYPEQDLPVEPYLLGLLLGDGSFDRQTGFSRLHVHKADLPEYLPSIPDPGAIHEDSRNPNVLTVSVKGLGKTLKALGLNCHGDLKAIPTIYLTGSIEQRLALLQGLMDTDGTVNKATPCFASNSRQLAEGVRYLVYSLGGVASLTSTITQSGKTGYRVSINLDKPVFRLARKLAKVRAKFLGKVALTQIEEIPTVASQCIAVDNASKTFLAGDFVVTHNTTLFMEYFTLFLAMFGYLPGFGKVEGMIYVSDSMDNGVKSARKNIEFRYNNSDFLRQWVPQALFTDNYLEFVSKEGHRLGVKMFGAKALSLDTSLYLATGGTTTIGACAVGDRIMGADGQPCTITAKSEVFHKPMYELVLDDGRKLKVSEDHLNQVWIKRFNSNTAIPPTYTEATLTTQELLSLDLHLIDKKGHRRPLIWIQDCGPLEYPENPDQLIDPYTVGVLLGDGSMNGKVAGNVPVVLTAHEDDWPTYEREIPYSFGKVYRDKRNPKTISRTVLGINAFVSMHGLDTHGSVKKIPDEYLYGSIGQRLALLQGLMDTDGTATPDGKSSFSSNSRVLVEQVMFLARSLGGQARWMSTGKENHFRASVRLGMPLFRLARKLQNQGPVRMDKIAVVAINRIADEPSQCIAVDNEERQFVAGELVRTHNTGLRGTKIFGKRPVIAVLDDLVSDDDSKSRAAMLAIKDTVYKGVNHALDPTRRKVIFNGTPFTKEDILIEAVESGAWDVNVWPVCERFPCSRSEFVGAWEDRFSFDYVQSQYDMALKTGKLAGFFQELMLRITSEEERLIQDAEIRWYSRAQLLQNRGAFNFYITTDFATSEKKSADYSVISVWAYNHLGQWFWVDGICERQGIDKSWNDLFRLVQAYKPQQVGIEITGQQQAYIRLLQAEMMNRNIWFNFASSERSGEPGIRPVVDKLSRLNLVVPWFKAGMMFFPEELKHSVIMGHCMGQIRLATMSGIKGKDDFLDTISMLGYLNPWKPSEAAPALTQEADPWDTDTPEAEKSGLASYIV